MPVEIDIDHVAKLARLELTDEEKAQLRTQLGAILEHAAKVGEVAADDVPPDRVRDPAGRTSSATDEPEPSITHEAAMENAPAQADDRFMVPKIAETGA